MERVLAKASFFHNLLHAQDLGAATHAVVRFPDHAQRSNEKRCGMRDKRSVCDLSGMLDVCAARDIVGEAMERESGLASPDCLVSSKSVKLCLKEACCVTVRGNPHCRDTTAQQGQYKKLRIVKNAGFR